MERGNGVALVSGANRGIGLAIARGLARQGLTVLLGCRDIRRGELAALGLASEDGAVGAVQLDTTDAASVETLVGRIGQEHGALDVLVNNAGIGLDNDASLTVPERLERTLDVNVVGTTRLTEAMLPLLRRSARGRIVNVSSELGSFGLRVDPDWAYAGIVQPTYTATKAALNALTLSYARLLEVDGIKVNAVCPGYTITSGDAPAGARTPDQAAVIALRMALLDDDGPTGSFSNDAGEVPW